MASQHYDAVLSNISLAYMQAQTNFIAHQVFPIVPVDKQSGVYFTYPKDEWLRDSAQKRADATESAGSGYTLATDSYQTDVYAFHKDVGAQAVANATAPLNPMAEAAVFASSRILLRQELDFANSFFKTGVWGTDWVGHATTNTGTNFIQFSNYSTSTPIETIDRAKEAVVGVTGFDVNTMVVGKAVFNVLKNHPAIIDRIKYTSADVVTEQLLAKYFGVEKFLVAKALVNSSKEGQANSIGYVYADSILLTHSAANPGLLTPSAGYTFAWTGYSGLGAGTYQIPMPLAKATRIEAEASWVNKVVAADLGIFLSDVVA
jgi:hypothetical protein